MVGREPLGSRSDASEKQLDSNGWGELGIGNGFDAFMQQVVMRVNERAAYTVALEAQEEQRLDTLEQETNFALLTCRTEPIKEQIRRYADEVTFKTMENGINKVNQVSQVGTQTMRRLWPSSASNGSDRFSVLSETYLIPKLQLHPWPKPRGHPQPKTPCPKP